VAYAAEYGADVVIARPCHVYGPYFTEQDNRVYAQFIRNVLNDEDIVMKSTGEQFRSWCYVVDCVSALLHILLKGTSGEAYNIADADSNISIRELAETIAAIGGRKVVIDLPDADEKRGFNPVTKSVFSTDKLNSLGWKPQNHISTGMNNTIKEIS
jgi:nucleoside-diphosphate-sugar epimerase